MATAKKKTGRRGLKLQAHYPALVGFVWERRFATAGQVYRAFTGTINSYFTAHYQCRRLVEHGYLAVAPARTYHPTFPHVLVATKRGLRLVADRYREVTGQIWSESENIEDRRLARGRSAVHLEHELLLTDVDLVMGEFAKQHPSVQLLKTERRYHQPDRQLQFVDQWGRAQRLEPDAGYFFLRQGRAGPWLDLCLLELDRANKLSAIGDSLAQYDAWFASAVGERYLVDCCRRCGDTTTTRPTFRALRIVTHRPGEGSDQQRLVAVFTEALTTSPALQRRLWLTTYEAFTGQHAQDASIWLRVSDARSWRMEYERLTERLAGDPDLNARQRGAKLRAFVGQQLNHVRRYTLFPPVNAAAPVVPTRQLLRA